MKRARRGAQIVLIEKATSTLLKWILTNSLLRAVRSQGSDGVQKNSLVKNSPSVIFVYSPTDGSTDTWVDEFYDPLANRL